MQFRALTTPGRRFPDTRSAWRDVLQVMTRESISERCTPATHVVVLVRRIREAPTRADLNAIRDELRFLPARDLDAEMLQLGIASRERELRGIARHHVTPFVAAATPSIGPATVRKFLLSRLARVKPVVSQPPRRN